MHFNLILKPMAWR